MAVGRQNKSRRTFESSKAIRIDEQGGEVTDAELYRHNADDCRLRSMQARMSRQGELAEDCQRVAKAGRRDRYGHRNTRWIEQMNRLRRFYENVPQGDSSTRVAYATSRSALSKLLPAAEWVEDIAFNAGEAILADPRAERCLQGSDIGGLRRENLRGSARNLLMVARITPLA